MTLIAGTRLGPYEVTAQIGSGGMGEVYRARDTKLQRDVALKVLPAALTTDGDRLARFRREAEVLASLNHPNITGIYGFEDAGETHALVMELVEGEDLSAHIARGSLALTDALAIARQIVDALEAAHEQGVIHRDLKPANVKVRADGTVKVLDFGLAKALAPEGSSATADAMNSPTLTAALRHRLRRAGHANGHDPRHRGVHGAGAGHRQARRQTRGHLGVWLRALRDAGGHARVRSCERIGADISALPPIPRSRWLVCSSVSVAALEYEYPCPEH